MVDMAVDIEKARHITYRAIFQYEKGSDVTTEATMAKAYSAEMVSRVCDQALQIHGGNGYMMEYPTSVIGVTHGYIPSVEKQRRL